MDSRRACGSVTQSQAATSTSRLGSHLSTSNKSRIRYLDHCNFTPRNRSLPLEPSISATYTFCSPADWRRMYRGSDPGIHLAPGTFPFLALPAELRNEIYRELLLTTIPLQLVQNRPSWPDIGTSGKSIHPTILQVNKQICDEGLAILYGENTWYMHIDRSVARYHLDMRCFDRTFSLPPPISMGMSRIRRIVMHAGSNDRTRTKYELYRQFSNLGILIDDLQLFAIQFPHDYLLRKNKRVNVSWLEEADVKELKARYAWFPDGTMSDHGWLVMKQTQDGGAKRGDIPGLGGQTPQWSFVPMPSEGGE
ncbi:hypothetical protein IQ07DRAFT_599325 [Pyrenochaeta sp. DS3sAY3a]|nr:hypothetical protein IQ07DRAFT_599325 [Pyrenochaeta sp. DS3sAY3a]